MGQFGTYIKYGTYLRLIGINIGLPRQSLSEIGTLEDDPRAIALRSMAIELEQSGEMKTETEII